MKTNLLKYFLLAVSLYALILGAWSVINGDLSFHADIARDFLLYAEITEKKIILIGPRADWKGLFHGPLWIYLNYPAYLLGNGNPVAVGWFWVALTAFFATCYYFMAKSLFNKEVGYLFSTIFLVSMVPYMNTFYNPTGGLFTAPFYLFFAVKYHETKQIKFLLLHLFCAGLMAQFQVAGVAFIILSLVWLAFESYKQKNPKLLLCSFILVLPLANFIIFNLRHNFSYFTAVTDHFSGRFPLENVSFIDKVSNRIHVMTTSALGFFKDGSLNQLHTLVGYFIAISLTIIYKVSKYQKKYIYTYFLYFYGGFFLLSFVHHNAVFPHYYIPLIALPMFIFSSLYMHVNKKVFMLFYIGIIAVSLFTNTIHAKHSVSTRGVSRESWKFLDNMFEQMYAKSTDKEFSVYLYTPDIYAYGPKHAYMYLKSKHPEKNIVYQDKRRETFLLYEPFPPGRPELDGSYWKSEEVKITAAPTEVINFPNGYRLERYELSGEDLSTPSITLIDDWVSQR